MPTPRPETSVAWSLVEKPGRKISCRASIGDSRAAVSASIRPFSRALVRSMSGSMPPPSSLTMMTMWSPSCCADSFSVPARGLPIDSRLSGASMPWSMALRTRCTSGSDSASTRFLSSSVSSPISCTLTSFFSVRATSRATFGKRENARPTGCMRTRITSACSRAVTTSRLLTARSRSSSRVCRRSAFIRLRASTSSPTRFIKPSRRLVSTRTLDSAGGAALVAAAAAAGSGVGSREAAGMCTGLGGSGEGLPAGTWFAPWNMSSSASNSSSVIASPAAAAAGAAASAVAATGFGAAGTGFGAALGFAVAAAASGRAAMRIAFNSASGARWAGWPLRSEASWPLS